jgi:hypothetical protein
VVGVNGFVADAQFHRALERARDARGVNGVNEVWRIGPARGVWG